MKNCIFLLRNKLKWDRDAKRPKEISSCRVLWTLSLFSRILIIAMFSARARQKRVGCASWRILKKVYIFSLKLSVTMTLAFICWTRQTKHDHFLKYFEGINMWCSEPSFKVTVAPAKISCDRNSFYCSFHEDQRVEVFWTQLDLNVKMHTRSLSWWAEKMILN